MLMVDCPLCDRSLPVEDVDAEALVCDACRVVLEIAEPDVVGLPAAA